MKKFMTVVLLAIGLMAMQSASAATVKLVDFRGDASPLSDTSGTVSNGNGSVVIQIDNGGASGLVNLLFSFTSGAAGFNKTAGILFGTTSALLAAGDHKLWVFGNGNFSVEVDGAAGQVPVPAAVWLFGSALLGVLGVSRRKPVPSLAA